MKRDPADSLSGCFAELAARELYSAARIRVGEASGALGLARALFGASCVRIVPRHAIPGRSMLVWEGTRPLILIREGLRRRHVNHCAAHELGEWLLRVHGYAAPDAEDLAARIAATICVPATAFHAALRHFGENVSRLSCAFMVSESLMALRVAECLGPATALITRRRIRIRGAPWSWPSSDEGWRELLSRGRSREVVVHRLQDARSRIVVRAL